MQNYFDPDVEMYDDYFSVKCEPGTSTSVESNFSDFNSFKFEDSENHQETDIEPLNEQKRKVRIGYRKKIQNTDSPKDRIRTERRRESNRKAAEKCRVKKRKIQSIKDKQFRDNKTLLNKLKEDVDKLSQENINLKAELACVKDKLRYSTDTNFDLDYVTISDELNFNSQNELRYLQD